MKDIRVGGMVISGAKTFDHPDTGKAYFDVSSADISNLMGALAENGNHPVTKDNGFEEVKIDEVTHMFLIIKTPEYGEIPLHFTGQFQVGT